MEQQNHNGQLSSLYLNQGNREQNGRSRYSIPGTLHFIQHEWARFEMERTQWEMEREELQEKIAFLQGERQGQDNLNNDLVKRIKMLECALKQERAKVYEVKYGKEMIGGDLVEEPKVESEGKEAPKPTGDSNLQAVSLCQGRQLLRQYLQEKGYADNLINVGSSRTRLGSTENEEETSFGPTTNDEDSLNIKEDGDDDEVSSEENVTSKAEEDIKANSDLDGVNAHGEPSDEDEEDNRHRNTNPPH